MESKRVTIWRGLAFWFLSTIVFKVLLNTGLFVLSTIVYIIYAIRERSWATFSEGVGTMLFRGALTYDHTGNVYGEPLLNGLFLKTDSITIYNGERILYGHQDDTISDITGRNRMINNLSEHGERFRQLLAHVLGHNHSVDSVPPHVRKALE